MLDPVVALSVLPALPTVVSRACIYAYIATRLLYVSHVDSYWSREGELIGMGDGGGGDV